MLNYFKCPPKFNKNSSLIFIFSTSFWLSANHQAIAQGEFFGTTPLSPPREINQTNTPVIPFSDNNTNTTNNTIVIPFDQEYEFHNNQSSSDANSLTTLYRVEVASENNLLLDSIRLLEPSAFIRRGEGIIQVGLYREPTNALNMVKRLSQQGITARTVQISTNNPVSSHSPLTPPDVVPPVSGISAPDSFSPPNPIPTFTTNPLLNLRRVIPSLTSLNTGRQIEDDGYFVIIPGEMNTLNTLVNQIRQVGVPSSALKLRNAPLGPHLAFGPFTRRNDVEDWNNYLRSAGLDARVYFGN